MAQRYLGPEPRNGAKARKTGVPSGKYPNEAHLAPRQGARARKTGDAVTQYPSDAGLTPRQGFRAKMSEAGDPKRPDIPSPNVVVPKATRPTPRPDDIAAPGGRVPRQKPPK